MDLAHKVLWRQQSSCCASAASSLVPYSCLGMQVQRLSSCWSPQRQLPRRDNMLVKDQVSAVNWLHANAPDLWGGERGPDQSPGSYLNLIAPQSIGPLNHLRRFFVSTRQFVRRLWYKKACFDLGCLLQLPKSIPTLAGQKLCLFLMT